MDDNASTTKWTVTIDGRTDARTLREGLFNLAVTLRDPQGVELVEAGTAIRTSHTGRGGPITGQSMIVQFRYPNPTGDAAADRE